MRRGDVIPAIALALALVGALAAAFPASAGLLGDLNFDGDVGAPDVLLLRRHLEGLTTLSPAQQVAADVAPLVGGLPAPDGPPPDSADLLILLRAVQGLVTLPSTPAPTLDSVPDPVSYNGVRVTGTAVNGATVLVYLDGQVAASVPADGATGAFQADLLLAAEGAHELFAVADDGGARSGPSGVQTFQYVDAGPALPSSLAADETLVLFPLAQGGAYQVTGTLTVPATSTLVFHQGADVEVGSGGAILVDGGTLEVAGAADPDRVHFAPAAGSTTRGAWTGLQVQNGATATIDFALVSYAARGIDISGTGTTATITNTEIHGFLDRPSGGYGIGILASATGTVRNSTIHNGGWDAVLRQCLGGDGYREGEDIRVENAGAPITIDDNDIVCADIGIVVINAAPLIQANRIEDTRAGIALDVAGDAVITGGNQILNNGEYGIRVRHASPYPNPTIAGNSIYGNGLYDMALKDGPALGANLKVVAEDNYWGTTTSADIAAAILDLHDHPVASHGQPYGGSQRLAWVDWVPFRDSPSGDLMLGNYLVGDIPAPSGNPALELQPDTEYWGFRSTRVPDPTTITIPSGVTIYMENGARFLMDHSVVVAGVNDPDPALGGVLFTSASGAPFPGIWQGIEVRSAYLTTHFLSVEFAAQGVFGTQMGVKIRDSLFDQVGTGVAIGAGVLDRISDSTFVGGSCATPTGKGILARFALSGDRIVADNTVQCFDIGIDVSSNILVTGNTASQSRVGIQTAQIAAFSGNTMTQNQVGLRLENNSIPPPMNNNAFFANTDANLEVAFAGSLSVPIEFDLTRNYWGTTDPIQIYNSFNLDAIRDPGAIVLDFSDYLNDAEGTSSSGTFHATYLIVGEEVDRSPVRFRPANGETGAVQLRLRADSSVTIHLCSEIEGSCTASTAVRSVDPTVLAANPTGPLHSIAWDGRDDAGHLVPEGAYIFAVDATDVVNSAIQSHYEAPEPASSGFLNFTTSPQAEQFSATSSFNAYENEFFVADFDRVDKWGAGPNRIEWVYLRAKPEGQANFQFVVKDQFILPGTEQLVWNGRLLDGTFLEEPYEWEFHGEWLDKDNFFLVDDSEARAIPAEAAPIVSIRSSPFLVYHSFEGVSRIVFRLSRDANVRVTMLPPGVVDPADPAAVELLPMQLLAAEDGAGSPLDHTVTWSGHDVADVNAILFSGEGVATFAIEAEDPENAALRTLYRGVLQVRR